MFPILLIGQSRSGYYGHPVYWFNRYKHKIPVVNTFVMPNSPTVGSVIDLITDRPINEAFPEPTVDEVYKEYLTLDSLTQDSLKNVLHKHWTQPMFNNSQSAVYRTYKYKKDE